MGSRGGRARRAAAVWRGVRRVPVVLIVLALVVLAPCAGDAQLRGGVTRNEVLDTSDYRAQQLLLDMYHDLSVTLPGRNPDAEAALNRDLAEFDATRATGSKLANQYSPCVDQYTQAYPHVIRAADLNQQRAPVAAINQETNVAVKLMAAANACQTEVDKKNEADAIKKANTPPSIGSRSDPNAPAPSAPGVGPFWPPGGGPFSPPGVGRPSPPTGPGGGRPGAPGGSGVGPPTTGGPPPGGGPPISGGVSGGGAPCPGAVRVPRDAMTWETSQRLRDYRGRLEIATGQYLCCPGTF